MPEDKKTENEESADKKKFSRRDFLVKSGTVAAAQVVLTPVLASAAAKAAPAPAPQKVEYPESKGYILYDSKKCTGCTTCMLSCSLVHYGVQNLSLARIQIMQDSFGKFPTDIKMAPCRQCVTPVCVENCPVGAAYVDTKNGNVRRIDMEKCIGCQTCLKMCPQQPHRPVWNNVLSKSSKCDLCLDTPYWNEKGGPGGKQACVTNCPMHALKFTSETPDQEETIGYDVKLRNEHWTALGLADFGDPPVAPRVGPPLPSRPAATAAAPEAPAAPAPPTRQQ
jgi:protein NrfC